jgi:hypothetical protein
MLILVLQIFSAIINSNFPGNRPDNPPTGKPMRVEEKDLRPFKGL